jgi:hypothetical protein
VTALEEVQKIEHMDSAEVAAVTMNCADRIVVLGPELVETLGAVVEPK